MKELVNEWAVTALLIADVVIFALSSFTQSFTLPPEFYWILAGVGFIIANIRIYSKLQKKIDEYETQEANIRMKLLESRVIVEAPILVLDTNRIKNSQSEDGLDDQGIPVSSMLYAKFEIENTGHEKGVVNWSLDINKSMAPDFFQLYNNSTDGYFDEDDKLPTLEIDDRSRWEGTWKLPLKLNIPGANELAVKLSELHSYRFLLVYKTRRIGGESGEKEIRIEGDLESFKQSLIGKWRKRGLTTLVYCAQGIDPSKLVDSV